LALLIVTICRSRT